ncbi:ATP-binding protein [Rhodovibrionaceae bacterium A322]
MTEGAHSPTESFLDQPGMTLAARQADLNSALLTLDPDNGTILSVNEEACSLLNYAREELLGKAFSFLFSDDKTIAPWDLANTARKLRLRLGDGGRKWFRAEQGFLDIPRQLEDGSYQTSKVILVLLRQRYEDERVAELLRIAFDSWPEALVLYDEDDRLLFFNKAYREFYPYMPVFEELKGRHFFDVINYSIDAPDVVLDPLARVDRQAYLQKRLERLHNPAPEPFEQFTAHQWHIISERRVPGVGFVSLRRDITDTKQMESDLREREALFRVLAETAPFALSMARLRDEKVVFANQRLGQILKVDPEELTGRQGTDFYVDVQSRLDLSKLVQDDGTFRDVEMEMKDSEGRRFWALLSGSGLIYQGEKVLLLGMNDISHLKAQEEDLAAANHQLEELAEGLRVARNEALAARARSEEANRAKSLFLAMMSHELRTPLNAVLGFSEVMRSELFGDLGADRYRDYVEHIHDSGSHLLSIINDILDISKIEAGKMETHPQWIAAEEMVKVCLPLVTGLADDRGVSLTVDRMEKDLKLFVDERALKQMLFNLLSNACKFTQKNGEVALGFAPDPEGRPGDVMVTVRDSGIGMSDAQLAIAMQAFKQVSDDTRPREGTGLGLPLVKGLVELHGGRLAITSAPNEGTCVTLFFPAPDDETGGV